MQEDRLQQQTHIDITTQENQLKIREEQVNKKEEEVRNREEAVNKREETIKKKEEKAQKENKSTGIQKKLSCYRNQIKIKQIILIIVLFGFCYLCVRLLKSSNQIISHIIKILNDNSAITIIMFALALLIALAFISYGLYIWARLFRRNQKAIQRINLLILRLDLFLDKDLVSLYRMDRELEMIYRILES